MFYLSVLLLTDARRCSFYLWAVVNFLVWNSQIILMNPQNHWHDGPPQTSCLHADPHTSYSQKQGTTHAPRRQPQEEKGVEANMPTSLLPYLNQVSHSMCPGQSEQRDRGEAQCIITLLNLTLRENHHQKWREACLPYSPVFCSSHPLGVTVKTVENQNTVCHEVTLQYQPT